MGKLYSIQIAKSGRYIKRCDEHWYETSETPLYLFTQEEVRVVAKQLKNHYIYQVVAEAEDGEVLTTSSKPASLDDMFTENF